ncbi:MAG: hypothetical protein QOD99_2848 [Chthoniobacter sp.]|jgi:hypothetical protein|nr:hypothetical protein [Chthoniobacter sp.]
MFVRPAAHGWHVMGAAGGGPARKFPTFAEAAASVPAESEVHLALPTDLVLLERMRLPATDRIELGGMMQLQLEKTLPFPADQVTSGIEIIAQTESESVVLAIAVETGQLDALVEPMRARLLLPQRIGCFAQMLARDGSPGETVCLIFGEEDKIVLAISEGGKLGYAQAISTSGPDEFFSELPQVLLAAELDGVPTNFARVRLDRELGGWHGKAGEYFGVPVEMFSTDAPLTETDLDLVPARWRLEQARFSRASRMRGRLVLAGVLYVFLLLAAAATIFWLRHRVAKVDAQLRSTRPQIEAIAGDKARWMALAPAVDPSRYCVEILMQVCTSLPSEAIRLTSFDQTPAQFLIEAEAPTASVAVDYGERLKADGALKDFTLEVSPPAILPNDHAQLRISGKL